MLAAGPAAAALVEPADGSELADDVPMLWRCFDSRLEFAIEDIAWNVSAKQSVSATTKFTG